MNMASILRPRTGTKDPGNGTQKPAVRQECATRRALLVTASQRAFQVGFSPCYPHASAGGIHVWLTPTAALECAGLGMAYLAVAPRSKRDWWEPPKPSQTVIYAACAPHQRFMHLD